MKIIIYYSFDNGRYDCLVKETPGSFCVEGKGYYGLQNYIDCMKLKKENKNE